MSSILFIGYLVLDAVDAQAGQGQEEKDQSIFHE